MANAKRAIVALVAAGLVTAAVLAAGENSGNSAGEQAKEKAQPTAVFMTEAFVVEVPTDQLYVAGVDPISVGGKGVSAEVLSKCLAEKSARITAGLKALILAGNSAQLRDEKSIWMAYGDKASPKWTEYKASTSFDVRVAEYASIGVSAWFTFSQSIPSQKADGPTSVRNLNWQCAGVLLKDATPTIVASQLDSENAVFLVMCVRRMDTVTK
jgi:hypothetical protein